MSGTAVEILKIISIYDVIPAAVADMIIDHPVGCIEFGIRK